MSFFGGNQQQQQNQFVGRRTRFSDFPNDKKKIFVDFEKNYIQGSRDAKKEVGDLLERISTQPDLDAPISRQIDNLRILYQQMEYMHAELAKYQESIRKDTSEAGRFESDVKRFQATGNADVELPPNFYWTKYNDFIERRMNLEVAIKELSDHVQEMDQQSNNVNVLWPTTITAVDQALQSSHKVLLNIAETVRRVHAHMDGIRADYRRYREERFKDFSNPFDRDRHMTPRRPPSGSSATRSGGRFPSSPKAKVLHPSSMNAPNTSYISPTLNKSFELAGIQQFSGLDSATRRSSGFGSSGASSSSSSSSFGSSSGGFGSSGSSSSFGASSGSGSSFSSGFGSSSSGSASGFSFGASGSGSGFSAGSSSGFGSSSSGATSSVSGGFGFGASSSSGSGSSSGFSFGQSSSGASSGSSSGFGFGNSGFGGSGSSGSGTGFTFGK